MFGIVLTSAVTLLQAYVFWRAASLPWFARRRPRWILFAAGIVLWAVFALGCGWAHGRDDRLAASIEPLGMTWMGVLFLTAVCLLLVDVGTLGGLLFRRGLALLRTTALIAGGILSGFAVLQGHRAPAIDTYDVVLPGLPAELNGRTVIALSDLHVSQAMNGHWLGERVRQAVAEKPDLIVLLGDIVEGHGQNSDALASALARLHAPLGVWGVLGNHESYGRTDENVRFLRRAGIRVLRSESCEIAPGLTLAGVDDLSFVGDPAVMERELAMTLAKARHGSTILLSHAPVGAEYAAHDGAGLMLSGHTHAGQIWPFSELVRRRYPLLSGRYEVAGMTVLVSRGTGTWGPRMRLWQRGTILKIVLRSPVAA